MTLEEETAGRQPTQDLEKVPVPEVFAELGASEEGLTGGDAQARLDRFGPNEVTEEHRSPLLVLLGYFWSPIPWMIEVALVLSLAGAALDRCGDHRRAAGDERRGRLHRGAPGGQRHRRAQDKGWRARRVCAGTARGRRCRCANWCPGT